MNAIVDTTSTTSCYHCGNTVVDQLFRVQDKRFCCNGCQTVYTLLHDNQLDSYYHLEKAPGLTMSNKRDMEYTYLDDPDVIQKLVLYMEGETSRVLFSIPAIHCASCVFLLENLYKINPGIRQTRVNLLKREAYIDFNHKQITLRSLVELLHSLGYTPEISLADNASGSTTKKSNRELYFKLGVAGFGFGNVMFTSLPEYFNGQRVFDGAFDTYFGWLNIALSIPVLLYSAGGYLHSGWSAVQRKQINMDVPISLGIIMLWAVSLFEILSETGAGYFDSFNALIFFLLVGKAFQQKTFHALSFDRDYKSYFPLAVTKITEEGKVSVPLEQVVLKDRLNIRNQELIPADSMLLSVNARIDYSFVTGESYPVEKVAGEMVFAGGRIVGQAVELEVIKPVSQSYLTQLWNNEVFSKPKHDGLEQFVNKVSRNFTSYILAIAFLSFLYWYPKDIHNAWYSLTSVLIIACPCALALSVPFTFGNAIRLLSKAGLYLKNISVIEAMGSINTLVFDKTGTLSDTFGATLSYHGAVLTSQEKSGMIALMQQSNHPLSKKISLSADAMDVTHVEFEEIPGKGILGRCAGMEYKIGSASFTGGDKQAYSTSVHVAINGIYKGYYKFENVYRKGVDTLSNRLKNQKYGIHVLSGDNDGEAQKLSSLLGSHTHLHFNQSPMDKLAFIRRLQEEGSQVMMLGDGLNDAGALQQAQVGVAVTEDTHSFIPACDAILHAHHIHKTDRYIQFSKDAMRLVKSNFLVSFSYNLVGLSFAVQGKLSPVIAAILMPLSSASVVGLAMIGTWYMARKRKIME